jgi:zinc/manganese transport system substrate-binding protein
VRARTLPATVAAALVLLLCGCAAGGAAAAPRSGLAPLRVLTSTSMWGSVARAVGGDLVSVTSLLATPGRDPHAVEATPRDLLAAQRADVVLVNGGGYDDFLARAVPSNARGRVIDALTVSRRTAGPELNEHLWYDLPTVARVAERLRDAYAARLPAHAPGFAANARRFVGGLEALQARERGLRGATAGRSAAVTEPVAGYLLAAVGLRVATPAAFAEGVEEDGEVAPAVLLRQLRLLTERRVVLLAANADVASSTVDRTLAVARDSGVPVLRSREILPPGADYLSWFGGQLDAVAQAVDR